MPTRNEIVAAARALGRTRFVHQGRLPGVGIDCIGLLVVVARALNIEHHDDPTYGESPEPGRLRKGLFQSGCVEIDLGDMRHGDIPTFWYDVPHSEQHVAILATDRDRRTIIHTSRGVMRVTEQTMSDWWVERLVGAWRFQGLVD